MAVDRDDVNLTPRKGYERYIMTGDSIVNVDSNISPSYLNVGFPFVRFSTLGFDSSITEINCRHLSSILMKLVLRTRN